MKIDEIVIVHYPPLSDRKVYMDNTVSKFKIPYRYSCEFNQDSIEIFDSKYVDITDRNRNDRNSKLSDGSILNAGFSNDNLRACSLEHYSIINNFAESDYNNILILQDDIIFDDKFTDFDQYINVLPENYDILYLSSVCGAKLPYSTNNILDIQPRRSSNGGGAYLVSKKAAKIIAKNALPLYCNWDWEMNCLQMHFNMNIYWVTDPMLYDGSEIGRYRRSY